MSLINVHHVPNVAREVNKDLPVIVHYRDRLVESLKRDRSQDSYISCAEVVTDQLKVRMTQLFKVIYSIYEQLLRASYKNNLLREVPILKGMRRLQMMIGSHYIESCKLLESKCRGGLHISRNWRYNLVKKNCAESYRELVRYGHSLRENRQLTNRLVRLVRAFDNQVHKCSRMKMYYLKYLYSILRSL